MLVHQKEWAGRASISPWERGAAILHVAGNRGRRIPAFLETGPHDSCKAAPQILIEQPVCVSLGSRHWGYHQSVWKTDGVACPRSVLGCLAQVPQADCASLPNSVSCNTRSWKSAMVGGSTPQKSANAPSQGFFLPFENWLGSTHQHPTVHSLLEERGGQITSNENVRWQLCYEDE